MDFCAAHVKALLQRFDMDGNGTLEREQFNKAIVEIIRCDKEASKLINENEEVHLTKEELDSLWEKADRDDNNRVSLSELSTLLKKLVY